MNRRPLLVGIAGPSGSGKTTLARHAAARLDPAALLITQDRYYHSVPEPAGFNYDVPEAFDTARLLADLDRLRQGLPAELPRYDFKRHRREPEPERVSPREVVLLEGILVLADPLLADLLDLKVHVHTDLDICLLRRIRRDAVERGRDVGSVLAQYERDVRPAWERHIEPARARAHLVLDGTRPVDELVDRLVQHIDGLG